MDLKPILPSQKKIFNSAVTHVIQSWEWGEFRKQMGIPLLRYGLFESNKLKVAFQITLHKIPFTRKYVGYLPKGPFPNSDLAKALQEIGKIHNCAFIKLEPNVEIENCKLKIENSFKKSPKPLFTKFDFVLDLTKSEAEILKNMHPKTRYNIKVAQKHGVKVEERTDDEAFQDYLKLYFETTKRQGYHGHNKIYHKKVWENLKKTGIARLLIAYYKSPASNLQPLTAWMLLKFKDTLYYPYGGSSIEHREVMANNLVCWEAIKLGKKLKLKKFDMWGALGPDANPKDPWFGFHKFKLGYGGKLVEYIGTYDLVFDWPVYLMFNIVDKLTPVKIFILKLLGK